MPRGQSATVNSASRGPGLTGKPVTESYLSLCVRAQIRADTHGSRCLAEWLSARARLVILSCSGMHVIVFYKS